jgi:hydrogenase nickel incorporation protein HypB
MCATCGCGSEGPRVTTFGAAAGSWQGHGHGHGHGHGAHEHAEHASRTVVLEQRVLARNDLLAAENRRLMAERGVVAVNLMSSPGSGKTTLLARTVRELAPRPMAVVEGDQETLLDAERIGATGCPVVQINTGEGCHLDAAMLRRGLDALDVTAGSLVFVENVGNLVCPALFDLGETSRVVVMSVTEGADKPAKYPHMFRTADLVLVNKVDLLPYVDFDPELCAERIRRINATAEVLLVSATTGEGLPAWYAWLGTPGFAG